MASTYNPFGTQSSVDTVGNYRYTTYQIFGVNAQPGASTLVAGAQSRPPFTSQRSNSVRKIVPTIPFGGRRFLGFAYGSQPPTSGL